MLIAASPVSHRSRGKHPLMGQKRAVFLQLSLVGQSPQLLGMPGPRDNLWPEPRDTTEVYGRSGDCT